MSDYWLDHIHLASPDPVKTADFYVKMFGAKQVSSGPVTVSLDLKGTTILISKPAEDSEPTGLRHFGIGTDNLDAAVTELRDKGVEFTMDKREIQPGFRISFLVAPENVPIELQEGGF